LKQSPKEAYQERPPTGIGGRASMDAFTASPDKPLSDFAVSKLPNKTKTNRSKTLYSSLDAGPANILGFSLAQKSYGNC